MTTAAVLPIARKDKSLNVVLRPIHTQWLRDAHRLLDPSLEPGANLWTRWAAVRYISDDFLRQYQREHALVDELRPFLKPHAANRLFQEAEQVCRLRLALDRIGRRRGTAAEFAGGARDLLEQLGLWCTEIELAACDLTPDILTPEGADLFAHLEAELETAR